MKQLNGFENAKVIVSNTQLPKGGYIAKILDCKEVTKKSKKGIEYNKLEFYFDLAEGEFKNHFTNIWNNSKDENKKWRGSYDVFIPRESEQYYEENLNRFKTIIANFEDSNEGYHWDWDETTLKDKYIGVIFREEEFRTNDGGIAVTTKPCGFRSVDCIREGKYRVPDIKKLKGNTNDIFVNIPPSSDDLPF